MRITLLPLKTGLSKCLKFTVSSKWRTALITLGISLTPVMIARPSFSAEQIQISYGAFERSIPVSSLETYAKTGKIDNELAAYTHDLSPQQLTRLRQILQTRLPVDALQVSQFLYAPIGINLLERFGTIIQPNSGTVEFYGLRAAFILAAADPQGLTLLNVLRKFPLPTLRINLARSLNLVEALQTQIEQTNRAIALINQQSAPKQSIAIPNINLQQSGTFRWQKLTIQLVDQSRNRTLPTDIYLPQTLTSRPIIVISHGLGSDRTSFAYLAEHLASYGFVVAVPEHPGSDANQLKALQAGLADRVTPPREFIDRPLDIRFLLDELTRLSQSNPQFQGRLNLQQVGIVGQSFGGYTALAVAGAPIQKAALAENCPSNNLADTLNVSLLLQCLALRLPQSQYNLADLRIKAAIAIDPVSSSIFGQASLSQIKIPTMIVAGSNDTVAPALPEQIRPFTWLTTPNKYLLLINNGTHFSTIAESANSAIPLPVQVSGDRPDLARGYMEAFSVAFFQTYVAHRPEYRAYLTPAYASAISQLPLPLSLVQSLSATQFSQRSNSNDSYLFQSSLPQVDVAAR